MRAARRLGLFAAGSLAALLLSAASASAAASDSTSMSQISSLFWVVAILAVAIGVFVGVVMVITILKFRIRKGHSTPDPNYQRSNHRLETAWTLIPAIILLGLGLLAFQTLAFTDTLPKNPDVLVTAIGHQWYWEFWVNYTGANGTHTHSVGGFTLKSNVTVLMYVISADVDHSLFIPDLGIHMDAIPSHVNEVWFEPTMPGQFHIECTQFCGLNHYAMVGTLTITP